MYDALAVLQTAVTKIASFNGAAVDLGHSGTPLYGLVARVDYSAASQASGSGIWTFEIQHSDTTTSGDFVQLAVAAADAITLTASAQAGEIFIPFRTSKRYVRLVATLSGTPVTPTITYNGDLGLTKP